MSTIMPQPWPLVAVDRAYGRWLVVAWSLPAAGQAMGAPGPGGVPIVVPWASGLLPAAETVSSPDGTRSKVYTEAPPAAPVLLAPENIREWLLPAPDEATPVRMTGG